MPAAFWSGVQLGGDGPQPHVERRLVPPRAVAAGFPAPSGLSALRKESVQTACPLKRLRALCYSWASDTSC